MASDLLEKEHILQTHAPHCEKRILVEKEAAHARGEFKGNKKTRKRKLKEEDQEEEEEQEETPGDDNEDEQESKPSRKKKTAKSNVVAQPKVVYKLGDLEFDTLNKITTICKSLLDGNTLIFTPDSPIEATKKGFFFLRDLFHRSPQYKPIDMVLIGVKKGEKGKAGGTKFNQFYYKVAGDDRCFPVQYRDCLKSKPPAMVNAPPYQVAFENAIKSTRVKFRTLFFKNPQGMMLNGNKNFVKKNSVVVYADGQTFEALLEQFLKERNLTVDQVNQFVHSEIHQPSKASIKDLDLKTDWIEWHKNNMKLQVVPKGKAPVASAPSISQPASEPPVPFTVPVSTLPGPTQTAISSSDPSSSASCAPTIDLKLQTPLQKEALREARVLCTPTPSASVAGLGLPLQRDTTFKVAAFPHFQRA